MTTPTLPLLLGLVLCVTVAPSLQDVALCRKSATVTWLGSPAQAQATEDWWWWACSSALCSCICMHTPTGSTHRNQRHRLERVRMHSLAEEHRHCVDLLLLLFAACSCCQQPCSVLAMHLPQSSAHSSLKVTLATVGGVVSTVKSYSCAVPGSPEGATAATWNL